MSPKFYVVRDFGLISQRDGKIGVVDMDGNIVLANEFKGIYKNDLSFTNPVRSYGDYYILAKEDSYSILKELNFDKKELKQLVSFPQVPSSYYTDYGGKAGFNLVRLVMKDGTFCYAREDGFLYYKKK